MFSSLEYIFNHVFLPVKLPQKDDTNTLLDQELCKAVLQSAEAFSTMSECADWRVIIDMTTNLLELESQLDRSSKISTLASKMKNMKDKAVLLVFTKEQNACVVIRMVGNNTVFEAFEVDPPNEVVMGATGRIIRSFPETSITVPNHSISGEFMDELASFLMKMSEDVLKGSAAHTWKAGGQHIEVRDTADPHYITGLLMAILSGLEGSFPTDIAGVVKHTRNDILWDQTYKPWRRSPLWLSIRVAIQLTLHQLGYAADVYKKFMVYFAADLLSWKGLDSLPGDVIFCAQSKLGHRMRKLDEMGAVSTDLTKKVLTVMQSVKVMLELQWKNIQERQLPTTTWAPSELDLETDTHISLKHSRAYLDERIRFNSIKQPSSRSSFIPPTRRRLFTSEDPYSDFNKETLERALQEDRPSSLVEIEAFVLGQLADFDEMRVQRLELEAVILRFGECITIYIASARKEYEGNPETFSIMILTVFTLWMVLDKLTTLQVPLLKKYSPEIPTSLLNPVLLSTSLQIRRYIMVQQYIANRHLAVTSSLPTIFDNQASSRSFAVRYFEGSTRLRQLKTRIEESAVKERNRKFEELAHTKAKRKSLLDESSALEHTYTWYGSHSGSCGRCSLHNQASELTIDLHEWPLPANELYAKWTVFECHVPAGFRTWRDLTYDILHGLCRPPRSLSSDASPVRCRLPHYSSLSGFACGAYGRVVTIASTTKSFVDSHYRSLNISQATPDNVSVKNGFHFKLFDIQRDCWIDSSSFRDCALDEMCTWKMSSPGAYEKLSYAVQTTLNSPNRPIADQSEAPATLDLHEHMSFGTLRSGSRLQWLNILRELHTRILSFSHQDVQSLVLVAALQAGPIDGTHLKWHTILCRRPDFSGHLLDEIKKLLLNIEENWSQDITLETLIFLTLRLLATHPFESPPCLLVDQILVVLRLARKISYDWMQKLVTQLSMPADISPIRTASDLPSRIFVSAALCRLTYNVGVDFLPRVFESHQDVARFVECSIRLHDNTPSGTLPPQLRRLLARNSRLLDILHVRNYFSLFVSNHQEGLHEALRAVWHTYTCGSDWQLLHPSNSQSWVTSYLESEPSLQIHLDLKNGSLLVNGRPLGRLPKSITNHATYIRLLGNRVLDVIPSTRPGSDFATRDHINESKFQLHFRLEDSNNLMIHSTRESECFELISHEKLAGDFPSSFVQTYVHWLSLGGDANPRIEFRPLQNRWEPSYSEWHLVRSNEMWTMTKCQREADSAKTDVRLVDFHSGSYLMICSALQPLDPKEYIGITWSYARPLEAIATVQRYKLSFTLKEGELHSDNLSNMIVDRTQRCGTLYGLRSILSLSSVARARDYSSKQYSVIIPYGQPVFRQEAHHIIVEIRKEREALFVQHFKYDVDTNLSSLVGTTLLSELYRIYLHAITSHFLPDPLLQHTGTEETVNFLRSSRCKSFQSLNNQEKDLLHQIANLTAKRSWYPESPKVMQSVEWSNIPPLSQHWSFPVLVGEILEYAERLSLFSSLSNEESGDNPAANHGHLAKRSLSHNLHLLSPWCYHYNLEHFCDDTHLSSCSTEPNRLPQNSELSLRKRTKSASYISASVQQWPEAIETNCDPWKLLSAGPQPISNDWVGFSLTYDRQFLDANFSEFWIPYYNACVSALNKEVCKAQLMFTLPAIAYQLNETDVVSSLLAFAIYPEYQYIRPPQCPTYDLSHGCFPTNLKLRRLIEGYARQLESGDCSYCSLDDRTRRKDESGYDFQNRRRKAHEAACMYDTGFLVSFLIEQWNDRPSPKLVLPDNRNRYKHINMSSGAIVQLSAKLASWYNNMKLKTEFLEPVHAVLRNHPPVTQSIPPSQDAHFSVQTPSIGEHPSSSVRQRPSVSLMDLLRQKASETHLQISQMVHPPRPPLSALTEPIPNSTTAKDLSNLLDEFVNHGNLHAKYSEKLKKSSEVNTRNPFADFFISCKEHYENLLGKIPISLLPPSSDFPGTIQVMSFHYPKINVRSLFALWQETVTQPPQSKELETIIRALAQSLLYLQWSQRLCNLWLSGHGDEVIKHEIAKELANELNLGSQPIDWLFVQIEGNFLARPLQVDVANKMIAPDDGKSTVIQLNMGEGKTSVIIPLVATSLADGEKLARVVVLKPLAKAAFSLLVQRLSNLANRRVFYFPFSRAVGITSTRLQHLHGLFNLCLKERGILVTQPEHILSFKLMGIDLIRELNSGSESKSTVQNLLEQQRWLTGRCRDIFDESDEILGVKYQLIYTSGRQAPVENHPRRWLEIQAILSLSLKHVRELQASGGRSNIECETTTLVEFPIIRLLDSQASKQLSEYVATTFLSDAKFRFLSKDLQNFALQFISNRTVEENKKNELYEGLTPELRGSLLLYRGFCAFGILDHLFREKRWRVNYGLHPARTLLAVPYRAKDVPAPRADFGHPDVAISLTCLSYYYGGLTKDQIEETVQLLFKLDDPSQEYSRWTAGVVGLSASLQDVVGINLDDAILCDKLHKVFKRNHATIDFYLANVVFPREAKQFPKKLTTSAWDLAEEKTHPTTGFSGTNDNQDLLPLSIVQRDPVGQLGTNARVLECLLQQENDRYLLVCREDNQILLSEDYLTALTKENPKIRVLLDVGAQMLDKRNDEIASRWLDLQPEAEAAVFFDDDDSLVVMTRDKCVEAFEVSTYSQRLECCLVYLDDAHTRGTDLKLPRNYRAAVTLGTGLNKDRLVQGCMRMRKLGVGQSVMFFAPQDVDATIRRLAKKQDGGSIRTVDVLRWVMAETCNSIHRNIPHWAQQGLDYQRRNNAWQHFWAESSGQWTSDNPPSWKHFWAKSSGQWTTDNPPSSSFVELRQNWEDDDARGLEAMYGSPSEKGERHPAFNHRDLCSHLDVLGVRTLGDVSMDEEQEREIDHEAEQERDVERPPAARPAEDDVHDDVRYLVKWGVRKDSSAFVSMFSPLAHLDQNGLLWSKNLWSTSTCATTIVVAAQQDVSEYQRPVHWLLTSNKDPSIVALSPHEVDVLLPEIWESAFVHLHMYAPRVNQTMNSIENLTYFVIPPLHKWTPPSEIDIAQLNLWAGQLYLKDQASYETLRMVLGIVGEQLDSEKSQCEPDGFVPPEHRTGTMRDVCNIDKSPLPFLREIIGLRQKGKSYRSTHMGKILDGQLLTGSDFQSELDVIY